MKRERERKQRSNLLRSSQLSSKFCERWDSETPSSHLLPLLECFFATWKNVQRCYTKQKIPAELRKTLSTHTHTIFNVKVKLFLIGINQYLYDISRFVWDDRRWCGLVGYLCICFFFFLLFFIFRRPKRLRESGERELCWYAPNKFAAWSRQTKVSIKLVE